MNQPGHGVCPRSDAEAAHQWWESLITRYRFSEPQQAQVARELGLRAAYQRLPQAHVWLAAVPVESRDESTRNWQARSALLQQDWPALLTAIDTMPADEQSESEWRYWKAYALALTGNRLFPKTLIQMIGSGEDTGRLDYVLKKVSGYYDGEVETALKTATSILEPLMIAVMGVVVGGIGMSVMLPIFTLSRSH